MFANLDNENQFVHLPSVVRYLAVRLEKRFETVDVHLVDRMVSFFCLLNILKNWLLVMLWDLNYFTDQFYRIVFFTLD